MFTPSREAALQRVAQFLPNAGEVYAAERNADTGPGARTNVSMLSPYLRYRLLTEGEVGKAAQARHGEAAAKFIDEVCWRTYWKGWLESRPAIWQRYADDVAALKAKKNPGYDAAVSSRSGIECLDAWADELITTGYLHNHARMWFASIWIHTLGLPWQTGADFFLQHLLDGDPASNTLSWRWVAGLHTRGKTYLATADNIACYTNGRFSPKGLAKTPREITEADVPKPFPLRAPAHPAPGNAALLLHEDDLHPESLNLARTNIIAIATFNSRAEAHAAAFVTGALTDARTRAAKHFQVQASEVSNPEEIIAWAQSLSIKQIVTPYAPTGPTATTLNALSKSLSDSGINLIQIFREWDHFAWPHATKGFFAFRQCIPELITAYA